MNILNQYDEYVKAYNLLAEKLDELGASDDIFEELSNVCIMELNLKYKKQDKIFLKNKQDIEAFEGIKKVVRNKLCSWDIEISKQFKICS